MSKVKHEQDPATIKSYVYGYVISIILTLVAYTSVTHHFFSRDLLVGLLVALALSQFGTQLYYFLHLTKDKQSKWMGGIFAFMLTVVVILVFGSLWIIGNLNNRMSVKQMENYMNSQDGL